MRHVLAIACTVLLALAFIAPSAHAGVFAKKPETVAEEAQAANLPAVTVWVEATWGMRNQGAANSLTKAHSAFAKYGYKVVSVQPYIENGDLQGFFVTYQKP
jgi:hypothetical protein